MQQRLSERKKNGMEKKYRAELDIYSGIAIIFVVVLHTNAYYLMNVLKLNSYIESGFLLDIIDKIVHISVPMFIFIAGYKYMMNNQKETYREYFRKKILNVFKPFFLVSFFYLSYHWIDIFLKRLEYTGVYDVQYAVEGFVKGFFRMFIGYNFAYQFWYIPMYLCVCLTYPLFRRYLKNTGLRLMLFISLAVVWEVIVLMGIPFLSNNPYPLSFIYYFFIYELGCIFCSFKSYQKNPSIIILLYIVMLIFVCTNTRSAYNRLVYDLVFVPVAVTAYYHIAAWIKENRILTYLGRYSFYIYIFHEPLVLSNLSRHLLSDGLYKSYFTAVILGVVSVVTSIIVYRLISVSPLKKAIIAGQQRNFGA